MIQVYITKENKKVNFIKLSGHAEYEDKGKDIVCASVSSILTTTVNAIGKIDSESITYKQKDNVEINILKHSDVIDKLIENFIDLLENIKKQYPTNIKIIIKNKGGVDCV